jgi:hypothetical protein
MKHAMLNILPTAQEISFLPMSTSFAWFGIIGLIFIGPVRILNRPTDRRTDGQTDGPKFYGLNTVSINRCFHLTHTSAGAL